MDYAEPNLVKLSDSDIILDEPWQDIRQLDVHDTHGEQIGSVEDLYVDRHERVPRFLDVSAGGFLGIGKKHFLIPVEEVSREVSEDRVTVNWDKEKVLDSPEFDPGEVLKGDLQQAIHAYYGHRESEETARQQSPRTSLKAQLSFREDPPSETV